MKINDLKNKSILILGYGMEGKSTHTFLHRHNLDHNLGIADKNSVTPLFSNAQLHIANDYLKRLDAYDVIIRSPGISPFLPEFKNINSKKITSATNIFFANKKGMAIGISGTKGKSSTSAMIFEIVRQKYSNAYLLGNIGAPMLEVLDALKDDSVSVVELSSHQLIDCHFSPEIAVILGIVPEHLDYYPDFNAYVDAKANLVRFQTSKNHVIFNPLHTETKNIAEQSKAMKWEYGDIDDFHSHTWLDDNEIMYREKDAVYTLVNISQLPFPGVSYADNILAAITAGICIGISFQAIREGLISFKPLPHRLEKVGTFKEITFYNDSLATVPEATVAAITALGENVETLICGGHDRHIEYVHLGAFLASCRHIKTLILFPDTGEKIWNEIVKTDPTVKKRLKILKTSDMKEAVKFSYEVTGEGKICLLSPAAASFNLFKDYKERGELFKKYVKESLA